MRLVDLVRYTLLALRRQRFRSVMLLIAVGLGVGAVIVLTALGEGARRYVLGEFAFLGKDTVIMFPGRKETTGGMPPITGSAARAITLEEVEVLGRTVPGVTSLAPMVIGNGPVSFESRGTGKYGGRHHGGLFHHTPAANRPGQRPARSRPGRGPAGGGHRPEAENRTVR